jgi:hypothetical protein
MKERYGDSFEVGSPSSDCIALFPAKHEKVGCLIIYEDEDSITFVIEKVTHDHVYFQDNYGKINSNLTIVLECMQFLDELFNDKLLLGLQKDLMGTVIIPLFVTDDPYPHMEPHYDYFVWSGPLPNPTEDNGSPAEE